MSVVKILQGCVLTQLFFCAVSASAWLPLEQRATIGVDQPAPKTLLETGVFREYESNYQKLLGIAKAGVVKREGSRDELVYGSDFLAYLATQPEAEGASKEWIEEQALRLLDALAKNETATLSVEAQQACVYIALRDGLGAPRNGTITVKLRVRESYFSGYETVSVPVKYAGDKPFIFIGLGRVAGSRFSNAKFVALAEHYLTKNSVDIRAFRDSAATYNRYVYWVAGDNQNPKFTAGIIDAALPQTAREKRRDVDNGYNSSLQSAWSDDKRGRVMTAAERIIYQLSETYFKKRHDDADKKVRRLRRIDY